jgi:hypothetical protein
MADQLGINPGDQIDWEIAGEVLRVIPIAGSRRAKRNTQGQLRLFDQATQRQRKREVTIDYAALKSAKPERGWTRAGLYRRGAHPAMDMPRVSVPRRPGRKKSCE